jgi:hypothetical protein
VIDQLSVGEISTKEKMVFIKAESIVEWNHEFDPDNVMQPKFWVLSDRICWYQIMVSFFSKRPGCVLARKRMILPLTCIVHLILLM